ncbi:hypothetical protein C0995_007212 [Termitomyces sp. Mi166|nr:hypothetical protein C0995_007212 [Termitomyces sp. Mi166\
MDARIVRELFTKAHYFITLWRTGGFYLEPLCIVFLAFVIRLIRWMSKRRDQIRSDSHQALLSIFIPTSSAWPSKRAALFNSVALARPSKVLRVSVSAILKNIIDGVIEARNPEDLSHILHSRLRIYGWTIQFSLDLRWRVSSLVWILESITSSFKPHFLTSVYVNPILCLDFIAYNHVERALQSFQSRLKKGITGIIRFTTMASSFPIYSDSFMLCCLPFTHRKYLGRHIVQRTSAPLLLNLHFVIKTLSSTPAASISSIANVTSEYITVLRFWRHRIVVDKALRTALVENWGERGWREHVFLLDWEIGLLDAGLLTRWSIAVQHL